MKGKIAEHNPQQAKNFNSSFNQNISQVPPNEKQNQKRK